MPKKESLDILDVGCGAHPIGDVNCDLFIGVTPHTDALVRKTTFFVRADAEHLPFRNKSFSIVHCSHVIEHVVRPYETLVEFKRVSKHIVYLRLPNTFSVWKQHERHLYSWNYDTFKHFLQEIFTDFELYQSSKAVLHGRLTNRIWLFKRVLTVFFQKLFLEELTAICYVDDKP